MQSLRSELCSWKNTLRYGNGDAVACKLKTRVDQKCVHISLAGAAKNKQIKETPPPSTLWKMKSFQSVFLKCCSHFQKSPFRISQGPWEFPAGPVGVRVFLFTIHGLDSNQS